MGNRSSREGREADRRRDEGEPGVGKTGLLLRAMHDAATPEYASLYDEVLRLQTDRDFDPSELVELSIKLSPRGFAQRRYGVSLTWQPCERGRFAALARSAAPTDALKQALALPTPSEEVAHDGEATRSRDKLTAELREWIGRTTRYASAAAYDFDARLYKLYLFKHRPITYFEDVDLEQPAASLSVASYIRCLEINMDDPAQRSLPLYFKLRLAASGGPSASAPAPAPGAATDSSALSGSQRRKRPSDVLAPGFTPHPQLKPRLLGSPAVKQREQLLESLGSLVQGMPLHNDPVVKFVPPSAPGSLGTLDYGVNLNLLSPVHVRFVEEQSDCILDVAKAFGCRPQAKAWLEQVAPYDCFLSYLGLGPDSVTFYYRSTNLHRGRKAEHRVRARRGSAERDGSPGRGGPGPSAP